jgi:hypothetical protein
MNLLRGSQNIVGSESNEINGFRALAGLTASSCGHESPSLEEIEMGLRAGR